MDCCLPATNISDQIHTINASLRRSSLDKTDYVKCNYDCRFKNDGTPSGMAWIIRDSQGFYIESGHSVGRVCESVLEAELQAHLMASQYVWSRGFQKVIFEGNNTTTTRLVNGVEQNFRLHNWICDIRH